MSEVQSETHRPEVERLYRWMSKRPKEATKLVLLLHATTIDQVDEWDVSGETELGADALTNAVLESAADHAEDIGHTCAFQVAWIDVAGKVLKTKHHKVMVNDSSSGGVLRDTLPEGNSADGRQRQDMRHSEAVMKMYLMSIGTALDCNRQTLEMQQRQINQRDAENAFLRQQMTTLIARLGETPELDPETQQAVQAEQIAKTEAWLRVAPLIDKYGPDVLERVINHFSKVASNSNGHASAAAAEASEAIG
jgi:hypothetical protein